MYGKKTKYQGTVYHWRDLEKPEMRLIISEASELWSKRTHEYLCEHGDQGSCVIGAGIKVMLINKRCRTPRDTTIIKTPKNTQGSLAWENSLDEILDFMRFRGLDATYECGQIG